ncbi:outer membrane beta-barrel protein [Caenimonas sedimenti]|uniref:Outer membrane beta-barrel protein n=1 Tax=Caenimonas sedimenti TaxID=2596921 RepID=A0A562ZQM0_9BURK|nr:outer membrane beta-barrel protein [Caenimonas sedimenti]TWO70892.1 outer membrane beta-barrel protein [Caenimonas sedimenti]
MNTTRNSVALGCLALAGLASPAASAQDSGWYAGGGIGRATSSIDDERIRAGLANQGLATSGMAHDERDVAYRLFGGYQFNRHFGMEAGWFDLGRFGFTADTAPPGRLTGDVRMRGFNLDLVGTLPLTERFALLGRAGVVHAQTRGSFGATGAVSNPYGATSTSERDVGFKLGAGFAWQMSPAWQLRAEAERYRIDDTVGNKGNVDVVSLSVVYRFGASAAPPPRAAAAPAPAPVIAASPAPAPAPVSVPPALPPADPVAPPSAPARVRFSADALFDFDRSTLRPEGQRQLDAFAQQLRGVRHDGVQVIGHTDRIGSKAYNLRLSQQRAAAVQTHLGQAGVAVAGMSSRGAGEEQPVTIPGDCKGNQPTAALVKCLQPDRRVEVEVTGTR